MLKIKPRQSKGGIKVSFRHYKESGGGYDVKEMFVGHRTILSLIGFTVGGLLIARTIWSYSVEYIGLPLTPLLGIVIFTISGVALHKFRKQ